MPYYSSDKLQKNTYSRKRGRNKPGVSPDEEAEQNESLRKVRRKLIKGPSSTTSEEATVCSPRHEPTTTLVSQVQDARSKAHMENAPSAALFIKCDKGREYRHANPQKSPAGVPGPFRRTQSQGQKENRFVALTELASPFKGASFKASVFSENLASNNNKSSKIFRRPSVDTSSTHIPSKTASFHRRPSGSHALQKKSKEYDSWIVPFLPLASLPVRTSKVDSPLIFDDFDIMNSRLRFSPQSCSTPIRKIRPLVSKTPDGTAIPLLAPSTANDVTMKDDVAVQTDPANLEPLNLPTISPTFEAEAVQLVEVKQNESICCDGDLPTADLLSSSLSNSSRVDLGTEGQLSSEPDSLNLGKMFSGLDIARNPQSAAEETAVKATPFLKPKKSKLVVEIPKKTVRFIVKTPSSKESTAARVQKLKYKGSSRKVYKSTPPRIVADDQPLMVDDDEDDELLLTSRGWDWDPRGPRTPDLLH